MTGPGSGPLQVERSLSALGDLSDAELAFLEGIVARCACDAPPLRRRKTLPLNQYRLMVLQTRYGPRHDPPLPVVRPAFRPADGRRQDPPLLLSEVPACDGQGGPSLGAGRDAQGSANSAPVATRALPGP